METLNTENTAAGSWVRSGTPRFYALYSYSRKKPKAANNSDWLNGTEVAEKLGISIMGLHRIRFGYAGHEPVVSFPLPYRFGGPSSNPVWRRSDIDTYIEAQRSETQ
jgi:predicted DNA-binding transcriptional regulator AlpA